MSHVTQTNETYKWVISHRQMRHMRQYEWVEWVMSRIMTRHIHTHIYIHTYLRVHIYVTYANQLYTVYVWVIPYCRIGLAYIVAFISFVCVIWLIYMSYSFVWHDSFIFSFVCVTRLACIVARVSFACVTRLIHMCHSTWVSHVYQ